MGRELKFFQHHILQQLLFDISPPVLIFFLKQVLRHSTSARGGGEHSPLLLQAPQNVHSCYLPTWDSAAVLHGVLHTHWFVTGRVQQWQCCHLTPKLRQTFTPSRTL